jgi:hypothetical protein
MALGRTRLTEFLKEQIHSRRPTEQDGYVKSTLRRRVDQGTTDPPEEIVVDPHQECGTQYVTIEATGLI